MAENAAEQKDAPEQIEVSKEEVSSASDVLLSIVKTSKAFKMYLANNPLLHRFLDDLKANMTGHLQKYEELKLDIDQFELKYKGKGVYENRDPKDSLAFKMYSDGIRSLIFSEGIEEREITEFLEILGKDRPSDVDDDIVRNQLPGIHKSLCFNANGRAFFNMLAEKISCAHLDDRVELVDHLGERSLAGARGAE